MWPTFYIPAVAPGSRDTDCWFEIVKSTKTIRNNGDGYGYDPDLYFDSVAGQTYRIVGVLRAWREDDANSAVLQMDFRTEGTHDGGFIHWNVSSNAVALPDYFQINAHRVPLFPSPYDGTRSLPSGAFDDFGDRYDALTVEAVIKATADTGRIGFYWGVTYGANGLGKWSVLDGSWIDIKVAQ